MTRPKNHREQLIAVGVRNLKEYGHPGVNTQNILTDPIYSAFFRSMLQDAKSKWVGTDVDDLLKEIQA